MVTVTNLDVTFRLGRQDRLVLNGITCEFPSARLTVISGPSGSGKTTLLSVMGCLLKPTRGSVRLNGQELTGLTDRYRTVLRRSQIGFVFQSHRLLPCVNVFENVAVALRLQGASSRELASRVRLALEDVHLGNHFSSPVNVLSGGERQRVAIARALVKRPTVILADEPTASLDGRTAREIVGMLQSLSRTHGCTVVVVTHDLRLLEYADKSVALEDGVVKYVEENG